MRTKIKLIFTFISIGFISLNLFAQTTPAKKNEKKTLAPKEISSFKAAEETAQEFLKKIKSEELPSNKKKALTTLLDTMNTETAKKSNIVTSDWSKILKSEKEGKVDPALVKEKDTNQAQLDSWVNYKNALQATYYLFIEKSDKYSCNNISEQIWADYTPIVAQKEKIELDSETKKAVELSIEIAEELCKYAQDL